MAFVNEPEKMRTIDYERNAQLKTGAETGISGRYERDIQFFKLIWGDEKIVIETQRADTVRDENDVPTFGWTINHLVVSPRLRGDKKALFELRQMLIEALEVFGCNYGFREYPPGNRRGVPLPYHTMVNIHPDIEMLKFGPEKLAK